MTPREAINQAKDILAADGYLKSHLTKYGNVRVPAMLPMTIGMDPEADPPTDEAVPVVVFTIEDTVLGKQLMAEFQGYKEFVA